MIGVGVRIPSRSRIKMATRSIEVRIALANGMNVNTMQTRLQALYCEVDFDLLAVTDILFYEFRVAGNAIALYFRMCPRRFAGTFQ